MDARISAAVALLLLLLAAPLFSGCAAPGRAVAAPPLAGGYYVLESESHLVSFEFFDAMPGTVRVVQSYEVKEGHEPEEEDPLAEALVAAEKGPVLSRVERFFYLVSPETGVIEFCPDVPVDQGEHTRAFLPRLPEEGKSTLLGVTGGGDGPLEVPFLNTGRATFPFRGRDVEVVVLKGRLGTRDDELHYSSHAGIIVYARFSGPGGSEEFRLVETNLPLVPGEEPPPVSEEADAATATVPEGRR